ncbi:hypothetical protein CLV40_12430 [Actinokineospora auranticolor]|uniref:Uncharacterized protein n=1 Tax=Actinokineospora auranticolor TaxID=155976 RepID=A0A2S6GF13_9PSEU|nr:hypothetical protein CLV40_12430 [Actinokineospora auranticolor]
MRGRGFSDWETAGFFEDLLVRGLGHMVVGAADPLHPLPRSRPTGDLWGAVLGQPWRLWWRVNHGRIAGMGSAAVGASGFTSSRGRRQNRCRQFGRRHGCPSGVANASWWLPGSRSGSPGLELGHHVALGGQWRASAIPSPTRCSPGGSGVRVFRDVDLEQGDRITAELVAEVDGPGPPPRCRGPSGSWSLPRDVGVCSTAEDRLDVLAAESDAWFGQDDPRTREPHVRHTRTRLMTRQPHRALEVPHDPVRSRSRRVRLGHTAEAGTPDRCRGARALGGSPSRRWR